MAASDTLFLLLSVSLLLSLSLVHADFSIAAGTDDGSEQWGYVEVRPQAHMFWWLYRSPNRVEDPSNPWPILLWLQGGPGGSGVGFGNFLEIGPLDGNLNPRNSTWLLKADLLFVDNPVGTGFSYVEDENLAVKTDEEAATDLTTLLKELFNGNESLQKSPLFIFGESYGGKFVVTLAVSALKAIQAGELKLQLGGVALGNSWISPEDFVFSWGPLLKDVSRIDNNGLNESISLAQVIQQQLAEGKYEDATNTWSDLEGVVLDSSNNVNFYNFMLDSGTAIVQSEEQKGLMAERYSKYLSTKMFLSSINGARTGDFASLMNGPIKEKLKIIPNNVTWGGQGNIVFPAMTGDFMNPRIKEVDELLAQGINVTVYSGQLDLICATKGAEAWMNKLQWDGLKNYLSSDRTPLYCGGDDTITKGFVSSYKNLFFYWILGAGHFVPVEQPCVSLQMAGSITRSPNSSP
ncbi:serine carboxypeptidase-like 51 isoform X4 [Cornus florida]|uniref:serine carboxypeptidase-like 51 isoform X4 n=1 Tax=Cornus florida TaxID=4283 RepID=UPI0028A0D442|nr:serine carboxypeptidase-like 51 isoform X4 [Cornus florida]